jgi:hypothetical protein
VLLRFYETKSFSDIATRLKISEAAAQKRVARSLEKVRQFFARKGFAVTAASLGVFLNTQTATAIPESIRASLLYRPCRLEHRCDKPPCWLLKLSEGG